MAGMINIQEQSLNAMRKPQRLLNWTVLIRKTNNANGCGQEFGSGQLPFASIYPSHHPQSNCHNATAIIAKSIHTPVTTWFRINLINCGGFDQQNPVNRQSVFQCFRVVPCRKFTFEFFGPRFADCRANDAINCIESFRLVNYSALCLFGFPGERMNFRKKKLIVSSVQLLGAQIFAAPTLF